jgi:hypothetical protein
MAPCERKATTTTANYLKAAIVIGGLIRHYNDVRLHATLGHMTPATSHRAHRDEVRNERARRITNRAHAKLSIRSNLSWRPKE